MEALGIKTGEINKNYEKNKARSERLYQPWYGF